MFVGWCTRGFLPESVGDFTSLQRRNSHQPTPLPRRQSEFPKQRSVCYLLCNCTELEHNFLAKSGSRLTASRGSQMSVCFPFDSYGSQGKLCPKESKNAP